MVIKIEATKEQAQRWFDFQEAEKVKGSTMGAADTWVYYDVIRLRRKGYSYSQIAMEANCGKRTVGRILKKARAMGIEMFEAQGNRRRYPKGGIHKCMS
jgi:DNA invertase Pin-like site-specific DNA recombinase